MSRFNLSEWALAHRNFVLYTMVLLTVLGVMAYGKLGQSEDPPFTFKVMLVQAYWPGATAKEMEQLVADRIEKTLLEAPHIDSIKSFSRPGETQLFVTAQDNTPNRDMPDFFYQVRKRVGDIQRSLPQGVQGPFFNDDFGETFGNVFALTGDGFSMAQLRDTADDLRKELLRVPGVAKVDVIGVQDEKVYVDLSNQKLANLGFSAQDIINALQQWNSMNAAGSFETASDRIYLRPSGRFRNINEIAELPIQVGKRTVLLKDVADIKRGYADPNQPQMRFEGVPAVGIGVSMQKGGDIIALGKHLDADISRIESRLPLGIALHRVNDQPRAVKASIGVFQSSVAEAVLIVLAVSFFSLGLRAGTVVALSIPLVLAATFIFMNLFDVGLHKISLGALILALGLLVDDAIIAVEMMAVKMEQGLDRIKAASFTYSSMAFPMLTGTLVTAAGFLPIATARSSTGEYTLSIFQVVVTALLISWVVAVIVIPYLGYHLLPAHLAGRNGHAGTHQPGWFERLPVIGRLAIFGRNFYAHFRDVVEWCITWRKTVIVATVALFALSIFGFKFVQQQFFPSSTRVELLVDMKLAEGSSYWATEREVRKLEAILKGEKQYYDNYVSYVGTGSTRFFLSLDQQLPAPSFAQFVVTANDLKAREILRDKLIKVLDGDDFTALRGRILRLENGPPVGYPVQFRVSGDDLTVLRATAEKVAGVMRADPKLNNVNFDWNERSKAIRLEIDQDKARALNVSTQDLSGFLATSINGTTVTYLRERDKLIEVVLRGAPSERAQLSQLQNLSVPTRSGKPVPLTQIARISYEFEEGIIWRRDRLPTITIRADIYGNTQPATVSAAIDPKLDEFRKALPPGFRIEVGGSVEESAKAGASIAAGMPLMVLTMLTVLMMQLQSVQRMILVVLTAPLGLIGVSAALLVSGKPFGFVAMLGFIALSGMIMRNSVILIDQIEQDIKAGHEPWNAVIDATVRRFRPIVLTALAAILAMIPLARSVFFGPMAVVIMGGLAVATALTLLFLPAAYAAWFRVRKPVAAM